MWSSESAGQNMILQHALLLAKRPEIDELLIYGVAKNSVHGTNLR